MEILPHNVINGINLVSYFHPTFIECGKVNVFVKQGHRRSMLILFIDGSGGGEGMAEECPNVIRWAVLACFRFSRFSIVAASGFKFFSEIENSPYNLYVKNT